ncbi:Oxidase ustYa [Lachnellula suecica]|uniref:Oxidase ustYa n=1 Tax=Lachnellula suecica TaxID=602035 RepID=A0A8T9C697_9HELO|nr:Oxidase ustYa [Lachnellula suecica]
MSKNLKYENVGIDDLDDLSTTEVDDSLMGDEKGFGQRRRKRTTCLSILKEARWFVDTILLLVILGVVVRGQMKSAIPKTSEHEVGGDFTGVSPHFSSEIQTFHINQTFAPYNTSAFFEPEVLTAWNELMPHGIGFQWINDTSKYHDLPTPIIWPEKTVFTTSMTHQLHCLFAVVQTYSGLKSNTTLEEDHHWHMIHCFDYMRQAIMCSADMALEGLETTFPDHNGGSDGWDSKHVCKNYGEVIDYLESVRAYDDQQIY